MPSAEVFRAGEILALTISVRVICIMLSKDCDYIVAQMRNIVKMGKKKNGKEDDEDNE